MKKKILTQIGAMAIAVLMSIETSLPAIAADAADDSIHMNVTVDDYALDYISDIVYSQQTGSGVLNQLKLDLIVPRSEKKLPLVVFLMGAGFMAPSKDGFLQQRMDVAEQGFVVASIEYSSVPGATFPAPLIDAKTAIRYLKAHSDDFNIDKNKVAVWGCSAGGYLASMIGVTNGMAEFDKGDYLNESSKVSCVVDMYGPSDLTMVGAGLGEDVEKSHESASTTEAMLVNGISFFDNPGGSIFSNPEKAKYANPLTYVDPSDPPFLIFHGTDDPLVSPVSTEILHEKLKENHVESTRYLIDGAGHGDDSFHQKEIIELIVKFLKEKTNS